MRSSGCHRPSDTRPDAHDAVPVRALLVHRGSQPRVVLRDVRPEEDLRYAQAGGLGDHGPHQLRAHALATVILQDEQRRQPRGEVGALVIVVLDEVDGPDRGVVAQGQEGEGDGVGVAGGGESRGHGVDGVVGLVGPKLIVAPSGDVPVAPRPAPRLRPMNRSISMTSFYQTGVHRNRGAGDPPAPRGQRRAPPRVRTDDCGYETMPELRR
jgi:hypothetical protein